nr:retrovirus-related Pol polyprotein from transposon TNT 1-94 [Tanacetum cinerariifolium]
MKAGEKAVLMNKACNTLIICLGYRVLLEVTKKTITARICTKLTSLYMTKSLANRLYLKKKMYTYYMSPGTKLGNHIDEFNKLILDWENIDIAIEDEDHALMLLISLSLSYKKLVETLLYGRQSLTIKDVFATLNLKESKKRTKGTMEKSGDRLYVRRSASFHSNGHMKRDCLMKKSQLGSSRRCMRTHSSSNQIAESSTIPRRRNKKRSQQQVASSVVEILVVTMADQRTMAEQLQAPTEGYEDAIVVPTIFTENFELKHGLLNLVSSKQFYCHDKEDRHAHIRWFNKITSTMRGNNYQASIQQPQVEPSNEFLNYKKINTASSLVSRLPSNTIANLRGDLKVITTQSGVSYDGPPILPLVVEREPKATKDKKLSLPDLTSTRMTLELASRTFAHLAGIAEDVFVQMGKFTFPADFVVVDYDFNPRVPIILRRPFLRMARVLVDVHGEELILRDGDEQLIFHAYSTSKHPHKHGNESINMINFIGITCEDCFPEVLKFKKSNHPSSGSTTPFSDSSPSLTPFEISDSLLEEFADELDFLDPIPSRKEDNNFDFEADLREIEFLLHQDPSTESNIETVDPILKKFTDEPALAHLPPSGDDDDDDDDLFDLKSDNDKRKKLLYGDRYKDTNSEKAKNKDSKMKSLIVEDHIVESNDLLPQLLDNDSNLIEESSESSKNASLSSSLFKNKDKVFNPCILILGGTQILKDESKDKDLRDKDLILEDRNFLSISFDKELMFFLELTAIETLLSFSSENEDKDFLDFKDSCTRGFVLCSLELQSLAYGNSIS